MAENSPMLDTVFKYETTNIIGLPPSYIFEPALSTGNSDSELVRASLPVMTLYPAYPTLPDGERAGLQLFSLNYEEGVKVYQQVLNSAGIILSPEERHIHIAFQNDASITESFSSEYGESKFESIGNIAADTMSELRYMTGTKGGKETLEAVGDKLKQGGWVGRNITGPLMSGVGGGAVGLGESLTEWMGGKSGISKIVTGSKIDFPMMWKGSGYSPSYSVTIRLYNPNPKDDAWHNKFIVEPLAKIVAFTIPVSDSPSTFSFPVLCSVMCPGLFQVKAGYVSSVEIIKGGDSNNISYIQRPGMVDVRMTFNDLYNTMISHGLSEIKDKFRPTFSDYVEQMRTTKAEIGEAKIEDNWSYSPASSEEPISSPSRVSPTANSIMNTVMPGGLPGTGTGGLFG